MRPPHIRTELPGPNARALLARDRVVSSPSYPRDYPFVMARGRGVEVWDVDGNRFLDFAAGIAVCSTGHAHPAVAQAIKSAADDFLHISSDYWHERMTRLAERINELDPMREPVQVFMCQSGTESVEGALKLARYVTGRPRFIAFLGGFHGRSMGSLALTASKYTQQAGFFPTMPGVTHVPYPNVYRPLFAGFQQGLRALCDRHGILLVFDEVQSGVGRTGKMFASEHWGVSPDIMTLAKGLGSGLPIGLVIARKAHMEKWKRGAHGNTFGGNPICCAAALATLDLVQSEYAANAAQVGDHFLARLRELQQRFDCIGDVRGKGLMIGAELVTDRSSRKPAGALCQKVLTRAFHNGLLLLSCGISTLRFIPPLMVNRAQVDEALSLLQVALTEALALP